MTPSAVAVHRDAAALEAQLGHILAAPADVGVVDLIVRRPSVADREVLDEAELTLETGMSGDNWLSRGSRRTADGSAHPDKQLNVINARVSRAVAGDDADLRALAGDQLHIDFDLSFDNLPPGARLAVGDAVIEVTAQPHTGCAKFRRRFGSNAMRFVNHGAGKSGRFRGICARVVRAGRVRVGDEVRKLADAAATPAPPHGLS